MSLNKRLTDVLIIGAGPCGLLAKIFLDKYSVNSICVEKNDSLTSHPSAHYINMRSMEILAELD